MRLTVTAVAAFLAFLLVMNLPSSYAQPTGDLMRIDSDISLTSLASIEGSAMVKLSFYGSDATTVRTNIINLYEREPANQILDSSEVRAFLKAYTKDVMGKTYWGFTIKGTTNFTTVSDSYILTHTSGLVSAPMTSTDPLSFSFRINGTGTGASKIIPMGQGAYDAFAIALESSVGYYLNGSLELRTRVSTYGIGSLTKPSSVTGSITAIRLPWGEILWYGYDGHSGPFDTINGTVTFESISMLESQSIAFVVLFIGCLLIMTLPGKRFDKFEKLHPRKFRKYAKPLMSVRATAYVLSAVLVVLYLFPYIFSFLSRSALFYAGYLYVLVPIAYFAEALISKVIYDKAAQSIPEESIIEVKQAVIEPTEEEGELLCKICYMPIEAGLDLFRCSCGLTMHVSCAEKALTCPQCGEPLVQLKTRSIQCRVCGESFLYSGDEDAYSIQCTKCGAFQEEIRPGTNYLIADDDPRNAFMMIRAMGLSDRPAMCLTSSFPGKIRSDYDLKDVLVKWFSDSTTDIDNVNPSDLEGDAMETVSTFLMTTKGSGVLLDGIDSLIELNGFEKVLAFVKNINDLARIHGSTIILYVNKTKLPPEQYKAISQEFSEIHDYQ
jgi:hypothetical protein